ncbi:hypothetical protein T484DRAFT_1954032 [Baffinella frigidus]|nr:hypothetical protein T484DRAFT_1954032 [Cryptophyta sp. CCMP2293]
MFAWSARRLVGFCDVVWLWRDSDGGVYLLVQTPLPSTPAWASAPAELSTERCLLNARRWRPSPGYEITRVQGYLAHKKRPPP